MENELLKEKIKHDICGCIIEKEAEKAKIKYDKRKDLYYIEEPVNDSSTDEEPKTVPRVREPTIEVRCPCRGCGGFNCFCNLEICGCDISDSDSGSEDCDECFICEFCKLELSSEEDSPCEKCTTILIERERERKKREGINYSFF